MFDKKNTIISGELREISTSPRKIEKLPSKRSRLNEKIGQGALGLITNGQEETQEIEMGVLSDGTPFLTQRGLARLCGIENAHIGSISSQWNESPEKLKIKRIKELLAFKGFFIRCPHIHVMNGEQTIYAYPDQVCLAVLEYYAFDAGNFIKQEAIENFRDLAGTALQDYIYKQVGYNANSNVPEIWKQFHDRMSLVYDSLPVGYFGVFKEIADMILTLGQKGLAIDSSFIPDISIGICWGRYWGENNLQQEYGERIKYEHNYPDYFPQAKSNPQEPWCYPEKALGEFRRWVREVYIDKGYLVKYITSQVKKKALPESLTQSVMLDFVKKDG